jgi:hypothetical protein
MVCRSVTWGAVDSIFYRTQAVGKANSGEHTHGENGEHDGHTTGDGAHTHPDDDNEMQHVHDVLVGDKYRSIKPGDRVLVIWVGTFPDSEPCVVDIIYPGTAVR